MDVVALGESMAVLRPAGPGGLAGAELFARGAGGAESNVACALAAAGHRVRWLSRLGADAFGSYVLSSVAGYGVDVAHVQRDPDRPTGVYFRTAADRAAGPAETAYYRHGSAASAMSPASFPPALLRSARILHLTGITAGLSPSCAALVTGLLADGDRPPVSFDVNHRPALAQDPGLLLALARRAELVFTGLDEAAALWGCATPEDVRALLPEPAQLVVKQGPAGATLFTRDAVLAEPAPPARIVAATGAGDGFAAGYLDGLLRGLPPRERLRGGHAFAAAALAAPGDLPGPGASSLGRRKATTEDHP
ncbi:sugar kinase [Streptomyces sp. NPDC089919]|uniref:sugar kinase n=1 Tax=Streptomyces sp. NPDC089919 TaxID=3155188 RepID=UPI003415D108